MNAVLPEKGGALMNPYPRSSARRQALGTIVRRSVRKERPFRPSKPVPMTRDAPKRAPATVRQGEASEGKHAVWRLACSMFLFNGVLQHFNQSFNPEHQSTLATTGWNLAAHLLQGERRTWGSAVDSRLGASGPQTTLRSTACHLRDLRYITALPLICATPAMAASMHSWTAADLTLLPNYLAA